MTFPQILAFLTDTHTVTPWALLTAAVFLAVYATRKLLPALWIAFDKITPDGALGHMLQGLPSVLLGALVGAIAAGKDPGSAWKGALAGAAAPVLHLIMKALPGPYQGAVAAVAADIGLKIMVFVVFLVVGCTSVGQLSPGAKTVITSVDDVAKKLCLLAHADALGVKVEQLAADVCTAEQDVAPFLPFVLQAKRSGAMRAGLRLRPMTDGGAEQ